MICKQCGKTVSHTGACPHCAQETGIVIRSARVMAPEAFRAVCAQIVRTETEATVRPPERVAEMEPVRAEPRAREPIPAATRPPVRERPVSFGWQAVMQGSGGTIAGAVVRPAPPRRAPKPPMRRLRLWALRNRRLASVLAGGIIIAMLGIGFIIGYDGPSGPEIQANQVGMGTTGAGDALQAGNVTDAPEPTKRPAGPQTYPGFIASGSADSLEAEEERLRQEEIERKAAAQQIIEQQTPMESKGANVEPVTGVGPKAVPIPVNRQGIGSFGP